MIKNLLIILVSLLLFTALVSFEGVFEGLISNFRSNWAVFSILTALFFLFRSLVGEVAKRLLKRIYRSYFQKGDKKIEENSEIDAVQNIAIANHEERLKKLEKRLYESDIHSK